MSLSKTKCLQIVNCELWIVDFTWCWSEIELQNLTLDLVLIHHSHHTFKNASCSDVAFEVFAEQAIRLKKLFSFFTFTLLQLTTRKIALIVDPDRLQKLNLTFPVQKPHPTQAILKCSSPRSKVMVKCQTESRHVRKARESHLIDKAMTLEPHCLNRRDKLL